MVAFSRFAAIACLLALSHAANDYCSLNYTMTLNITQDWVECQRGDGVWAYEDPAGGCCLTLGIDDCVADESCVFMSLLDTCGICFSVGYINDEFNLTATTCEDVSMQFETNDPITGAVYDVMCEATAELDCCWEGNNPIENYNDTCTGRDADSCVWDGEDSTCAVLYTPLANCYQCQGLFGLPCADIKSFYGSLLGNFTFVTCDSSDVDGLDYCDDTPSDFCFNLICYAEYSMCEADADCNMVISNVANTGDYAAMAAAAQNLCSQDGYTCTTALDDLTNCMMNSCVFGGTTSMPESSMSESSTEQPETTEESEDSDDENTTTDSGVSEDSASQVCVVVAMIVAIVATMLA